jgi:hypothetical protein
MLSAVNKKQLAISMFRKYFLRITIISLYAICIPNYEVIKRVQHRGTV